MKIIRFIKKIKVVFILFTILFINPIIAETPSHELDEEIQFKYIIITTDSLKGNFIPLIDYKSNFLPSTSISIEDIVLNKDFWVFGKYGDATNRSNGNLWINDGEEVNCNFSLFNDTQAKIRNFIRFAFEEWKTEYILLGGDHELIPSRRLYCYVSNWTNTIKIKPIQSSIISDHYFSALNGSWNIDCDERFGEEMIFSKSEEADFTSEVCIGRAPVNDKNDVNVFVQKVISFEISDKPHQIQVQQSYIQPNKIPDTVPVAENCIQWIPNNYSIKRLYERDSIVTSQQWIDAFHSGETLLFYQIGNGYNDELFSWYQLSWNGPRRNIFSVLDVGQLHNSFFPIHFSISCQTADFSEDECLAEELLLTQKGGAAACIGNTEVGCLNITDATRYSSEFFEKMFYELFRNNTENLGRIIQKSKEYFINKISSVQQYRWCFYELVLLGDPEMPVLSKREKINNEPINYYVDDDFTPENSGWNKTHFSSIQSAHDNIEEFGRILIYPGTYTEHIVINKTLIIEGVHKNLTILSNCNTKPILTLKCHTTTIKNLTICNDLQNQSNYPASLILIEKGFNGNHIEDNLIEGKATYSILLKDSIRNHISNNIIQDTKCSIGIINTMDGFLPTSVIVTCDNVISNNIIQRNQDYGIYIESSIHNYIINNVFLKNGINKTMISNFKNENNICLVKTKLNTINGNFWEKANQKPYPLWSIHGPITIFSIDISKGILFKYYKCILILNIGIPLLVYDNNPAVEP